MRDDMISCLIQLVQEASNLHAYTVQQLYRAMSADISQQPLLQVATWCIGEFGDQLFTATSDDDEPVQVCTNTVQDCQRDFYKLHVLLMDHCVKNKTGCVTRTSLELCCDQSFDCHVMLTTVRVCFQATEEEVLEVLERVLVNNNSLPITKQYTITAVVKLSTRFHSPNSQL